MKCVTAMTIGVLCFSCLIGGAIHVTRTIRAECGNSADSPKLDSKCMWVIEGGNLTESNKGCEKNGGWLFTFESVDEGVNILTELGVGMNTSVFVGAIQKTINATVYYDWLSRPGTWSPSLQVDVNDRNHLSTDHSCLTFESGRLNRASCSSNMNISVCERGVTEGCRCKNGSDEFSLNSTIIQQISTLQAPPNTTSSIVKPTTALSITTTQSLEELVNGPYSDIFNHVLSRINISGISNHILSPSNATFSNSALYENRTSSNSLQSGASQIQIDNENKSTNYCTVMHVLNMTFGSLLDKILGQGIPQNGSCTSNQGNPHPSSTTTVTVVEEKSTIPVTELKFHFVSGIRNGPAMTGSKYNPPLRIDLHSTDYGILVNISRQLMDYQSIKDPTNKTLQSFVESVSNWTTDDRLMKEKKIVQSDLFEDILQVGEALVGKISSSESEIRISSGSIDVISKIVEPTENSTHTDFGVDRESSDVDVKLSNMIFSNDSVKVRVSTITYRKMDTIVNVIDDRISSDVMSVTVKFIIRNTTEQQSINTESAIIFAMRTFLNKDKQEQQRLCTYWSFSKRQWTTEGCDVIAKNSSFTTCSCNHLTNFAILVMYMDIDDISLQSQQVLFTLTTVGCSLSIACLAMTLITYIYLRMLGNEKIMIHANLSLALMMAQIVFVSSTDAHKHETACKVVALLLHFLFMASFSWMMVEGIALYMTCTRGILANINRDMKVKYFIFGWGVPAIIVVVSSATHFPSYGAGPQYSCWLSTQNGLIWAFLGPMLVIVLLNMGVMGLVVKVFLTLRANTEKSELARLRGSLRAMLTLLPLLGLGWVLSLLVPLSVVFNYFFVIVNTLQGMCIFFLHCICNDEIRKLFREKRRRWSTTRTASDFDVTFHSRRKHGSFDGVKSAVSTVTAENNSRRQVWKENGNT